MAAEFVGDQGEVDQAGSADGAAAVLFADEQRRPPELAAPTPVVGAEPGGVVAQSANLVDGHLALEELGRRLAEEVLVGGQVLAACFGHTPFEGRSKIYARPTNGRRWGSLRLMLTTLFLTSTSIIWQWAARRRPRVVPD